MKPHRHAEIIKEFVNGKECEYHIPYADKWEEINFLADFDIRHTVRIKPEPKPDIVLFGYVYKSDIVGLHKLTNSFDNIKLTYDGETGELKLAEVIK
jgi:hypothetical protein